MFPVKPVKGGIECEGDGEFENASSSSLGIKRKIQLKQNENVQVDEDEMDMNHALMNARLNIEERRSPGAGLKSADEQSDAAYADLINTTMEQRGLNDLGKEEKQKLERGGRMWEKNSLTEKNRLGIFGDILSVMTAFVGGAHIEKNKFGET